MSLQTKVNTVLLLAILIVFISFKDLVIDFTNGDIFIHYPEVILTDLSKEQLDKLTNKEKYGLYNLIGKLSSVYIHNYNRFYIMKSGIQYINNLELYNQRTKNLTRWTFNNILFKDYNSDSIINLLLFRQLCKNVNTGVFKGSVAVNNNLIKLHDKINLRVISGGLTIPKSNYSIPDIERHTINNYKERSDLDKRLISTLLNLTVYSVIYNKTDLFLHDGEFLKNAIIGIVNTLK